MGVSGGDLDVRWIHGSARRDPPDPPIQVHRYDEHTYLMRQSMSTSHEAPFLYLLFGAERALLLDTGATADPAAFPLRETVDSLVAGWLAEHPRPGYHLLIAHTHGHGDHVAADGQFEDRPDTTVVAKDLEAVQAFWGFADWPTQTVRLDLGDRVLEAVGSPGHHATAVTVFDRRTGFLLTGDTVYPGRLYAFDPAAFAASLERLVEFVAARPVSHVMGCHIEMSRLPGADYPLGATYQPDEPPLPMTVAQLVAVRDAARELAGRRGIHRYDDFVIVNGVGSRTVLRLYGRALWAKTRRLPANAYARAHPTRVAPPKRG
jgi:glyoxylase-like metal-dependent hydrolase (beta-lactamase superfamily II)